MAQATADLPDPDDLAAGPMDSLDELLSQLVTRDIERMLAEHDAVDHPALAPDLTSELNEFFNQLQKAHSADSCQHAYCPSHRPWYLLPLLWIFQLARISR